jgi:signal transduction histidine kinase
LKLPAFRDLPVRRKLMLIVFLASSGALLLANAALLAADVVRFRREMVGDLETLGEILAENMTAPLSFNDPVAANDTLRTLGAKPPIAAAALYNAAGHLFAHYTRVRQPGTIPDRAEAPGHRFTEGAFLLFWPVRLDGKTLGTLYIESDLREMYSRLRLQAVTVTAVLFAAGLVALLFSSRLQRWISEPISDLADTAKAVSERRDYALRATRRSSDELGALVDAFNQMLAQIQERDAQLQQAKEGLEKRVAERTVELQQELAFRRQAEAELEERNAELRQSNKELDDFAYIASHDLKEPLRGIHNFSLFLLEDYGDKLDAEGKSKLETLPRLTRRMESLIDSLLHFSRVGRIDLAIDRVNLNEILADILDSLGPHLTEKGIEIRVPRSLPTVLCDRARVGEIFRNLVTNAAKYNAKPEKWVEIGYLEPLDPPGNGPVVFYVRDNGIGIPEKHYDSIFRIFKRLHGRDQFGGGTGAGLTIVKKIVERHNGRVWLESTPGLGTTFNFTLERGA